MLLFCPRTDGFTRKFLRYAALMMPHRPGKSRLAGALRLAAQNLWQARNYFGDLFRRWKARLGKAEGIVVGTRA